MHRTLLDVAHLKKLVGFIVDSTFDVASDAVESFTVGAGRLDL